jgi:hypothetical protein
MIATQEVSANLFPRNSARRIDIVRLRPAPKFFALRFCQRNGIGTFDGDAVPDVFDELDTLGYRQIVEIACWSAHVGSISLTTDYDDAVLR